MKTQHFPILPVLDLAPIAPDAPDVDDVDDAATQFATSRRRRVRGMIQRGPAARDYPDDQIDAFLLNPAGKQIAQMARYTAVATPDDVREYLGAFAQDANADKLITVHCALSVDDRERSLRLAAPGVAAP